MRLQELDAPSARLCLNIEKEFRRRFVAPAGSRLLLAVSGGADSIAMAGIFLALAPRLQVSLSVAHVNHGLRSEALLDADLVAQFCSREGLEFALLAADVGKHASIHGLGIEEAGREIRYQLLEQQRLKCSADYILVAHHGGDLAEDILMRLARGAGWPGLGGMHWQNGRVLRPLLHADPDELRAFATACGYRWREDQSNRSLAFQRNRFRHVVLPLLRCENPAIDTGLTRLHELANIDSAYWDGILAGLLAENPWEIVESGSETSLRLPRRLLEGQPQAVRLRLYFRALAALRDQGQTRTDSLLRLDQAFAGGQGGKVIQCSGRINAHCGRDGVVFRKFCREADPE